MRQTLSTTIERVRQYRDRERSILMFGQYEKIFMCTPAVYAGQEGECLHVRSVVSDY